MPTKRTAWLATLSVAGASDQKAHDLFPRLAEIQGGRIPTWEPTANDTKRCSGQKKPKYCLHFARRFWCVRKVEQAERTFGNSWIFNDQGGRDRRDDFHFCQQYRFYDFVQKRAREKKKHAAGRRRLSSTSYKSLVSQMIASLDSPGTKTACDAGITRNQSFWLTRLPNSTYMEVCVPAKAGYSTMTRLLGYAAGNMWNHMAKGTFVHTACALPARGAVGDSLKRGYLVVRNPYERLLSAFLAQVAAPSAGVNFDANARAQLRLTLNGSKVRYGAFAPTPAAFAEFVRQLTSQPPPGPDDERRMSKFALDHLAPISSSPRPCLRPEYRLNLPFREYYTILKLELQADWYADWVRDNHLARWTQDRRWPGGCFWRAHNASCEATLSTPELREASSRRCHDVARQGGTRSNTRACMSLRTFYTDELAGRVGAYAADDLSAFAYPAWLPSWSPVPDAGPPVHTSPPNPASCSCH